MRAGVVELRGNEGVIRRLNSSVASASSHFCSAMAALNLASFSSSAPVVTLYERAWTRNGAQ
jgi:hypothetical protein